MYIYNIYIYIHIYIYIPSIQKTTGEILTRSGNSLGQITTLTNAAMFRTACSIVKTWHNAIININTQVPAKATRNKICNTQYRIT